jgi:hypothetical protein
MKRWVPVLGIGAVLVLAWFATMFSSPAVTQLPLPSHSPLPPASIPARDGPGRPRGLGDQGGGGGGLPDWLLYTAGGLALAVIAVVLGWLLYRMLKALRPPKNARPLVRRAPAGAAAQPRADDEEVLAAVDAGLVELSADDTDPRKAVIACWVRLERAAAAAGTPRQPGDSPTELVLRLLSAHQVSRGALQDLAAVYLEARYATHPIGERDRGNAIRALEHLRAELTPARPLAGEPVDG